MHAVRLAVRENALRSTVVTVASYLPAIEETGRGWVVEVDGEVVAFAVGNRVTGNIWALFVHPEHEGRGHGRKLHDAMLSWLFAQGVERAWLSTDAGTRAQRFYEHAGWQHKGVLPSGEVSYEYPSAVAALCLQTPAAESASQPFRGRRARPVRPSG